jgi:subtilisin-like proprotein convertase family protein
MRQRRFIWILLCLLCAAGAWFFWHRNARTMAQKRVVSAVARSGSTAPKPRISSSGVINTNVAQISVMDWNTNKFAGRLSNTPQSIGQLVHDNHAILLANALIDTRLPLNFVFPKNLQPRGDPGAYIVQADGPINDAFRALLAQAGAKIVSYIPNDAYLVRASAAVANALEGDPPVQAVIPYEPYYKIQSSLLYQAVKQVQLPDGAALNLGLFADNAPATIQQIEKLGGQVVGQSQSPFGPEVRVVVPKDWTALATLPGVQIVEGYYQRQTANDLARATMGVAADSLTSSNYLGLTGKGVMVEVNDTGIDAQHPDLSGGGFYNKPTPGVIGDAPQSLVDTNGHGTHVAGIIAGDGAESTTVTDAPGSTLPGGAGTNYQFRGMAPAATLFSVGGLGGGDTNVISDQYFQEVPARTNALISNNSWVYEGDSAYDLAAASYDAAVRDALPTVSGSQPVLFVFAAGNDGNGDDGSDPGGGTPDSIESPATAKDVITVGAIQEDRNITNSVTNADGTVSEPWQAETSTDYRVAGFSARGNVGIGIEGSYGRFKPDVVAPGTFIISDRSEQWDINSYFYQNPTNYQIQTFSGYIVEPGQVVSRPFPSIPTNAVQLTITTYPNANSPYSFAQLPTLIGLMSTPGYQYLSTADPVVIPGAGLPTLQQILSTEGAVGAFNYAISNNTASQVVFDLETDVITTNGSGDYYLVLSNLDNSIGTPNPASTGPGPYYRYESGTSMSAADVSGVLALMQQFYENAYGVPPSPAMLKAMLINGAQVTSSTYDYDAQGAINYEGWGLVNLPDSLPIGITNQLNVPCSAYVQDQNPTNALATGDSQTLYVTTTNAQPLRVTLAWTDPPGDPTAAIKLVNNLVLVVTNLSDPTNPIVYYGNDIPAATTYNTARATNTPPVYDSINNVQTVNLQQGMGTNFSVTVMGYRVNVNAVTAQTNNVVQDYALVISSGTTNEMTVTATPASFVSNPTGDQRITYLSSSSTGSGGTATSYAGLLNQFAGANSPLLGTNTILFSDTTAPAQGFGPNNWQVTVGQTNQWQFYVVTNVNSYSNAAFITYNPNAPEPDTLSVPREGVFAGSPENASRDADIDLYVSTDPTLTNLNPVAISNAVVLGQIGGPPGANFAGASLGPGSTEFVVDTNAWSRTPNVYYIGVKSEDQMSAEYGFISIFSQLPFSQQNANGQTVYGVPVPANIPDGSPKVPGKAYVFGLAIYPMQVGEVTVSNVITHQNFGDLIGTLTLNGSHPDVLNNHDSLPNPPGPYYLTYDDSAGGGIAGSRPSDGPGSLIGFTGRQAIGVWMLTEVDDSLTQTGMVDSLTLNIVRHQKPTLGIITNYVAGGSWVYDYIDVPPGATNLTLYATNLTGTANPPVELFVKYGSEPTTNDYDGMAILNPSGVVSLGPPLVSGTYYFGLYNPNPNSPSQEIVLYATIQGPSAAQTIYSSGDTPIPIPDDAVTTDSMDVTDNETIASLDVAIAVRHPRISDLVFHLISPDGTRDLLMENRGGTDPNGAGGISTVTTNIPLTSDFDTALATNYASGGFVAGWTVANNQVSVQTDPANAYGGASNLLALANGTLSANLPTTPGATYTLTFHYRGPGIVGWWRGENNYTDSSGYGNDPSARQNVTFTNGEVGQAFDFNGTNSEIEVPASANLNVGVGDGFTIEGWINPPSIAVERPIVEWDDAVNDLQGAHFWFSTAPTLGNGPGCLYANIVDTAGNWHHLASAGGLVVTNQFQHVALTYNKISGVAALYLNGTMVQQQNLGASFTPQTSFNLYLGHRAAGTASAYYGIGALDEISIYNRFLSPSEIQAISADGANGKFDPAEFLLSPPSSLAEAQLSVNGNALTNVFGNNTAWQTYTVSFKATSSSTSLQIQGLEPGMLLDDASVESVTTNYSYLVFTENTNLTTTPIKFAVPPFAAHNVATNGIPILAGPIQDPANGHYYYLLDSNTWTGSEAWAEQMGGHLATITDDANNQWVYNIFSTWGGITRGLWIGFYDPTQDANGQPHASNFVWVSGAPITYTDWWPGEPNDSGGNEFYTLIVAPRNSEGGYWNDVADTNYNWASNGVVELDTLPSQDLYYLPEESLDDAYDGENAYGTWTLEIQDDRVGATNPPPQLLSWQLRFTYVTTGTNANGIPPGTQTNVIQPGSWAYYPVNVPTNADYATNLLVFATGPLDMWFNSSTNPIGVNPPDNQLLSGVTSGSSTLSTFSTPTNIVPGGVYYIGLYNPNPVPVTNGFEVDFHYFQTRSLMPGVPITNTVAGTLAGDGVDYYSITVPKNADYATNLLLSSTTPVNVWFNQNKDPVCLTPPDSLLIGNATSGVSTLSAKSTPPLVPGATYYLAVQNTNAPNATYTLEVNFHLYSPLTNGVPATNSIPTNSFAYYTVQVPTNADYATNLLLFASQPVNVWFNQYGPPIGLSPADSLLIANATNGVSILSASTTPSLVPGSTYYLGVQNTNATSVNFGLEVNFHLATIAPITNGITITGITFTNIGGTNGVLLTWFAPTNYQFQVQWATSLSPPIPWTTIPGVLLSYLPGFTPTNGIGEFQYFDDGTLTGGLGPLKFYRLIAYPPGVPVPQPLVISHVQAAPGGLQIQWDGSTNDQYAIQWTTNLALPESSWNVLSNLTSPTLTYAGGVFTFTDDGSLTGGAANAKFFRVQQTP